MEKTIKRVEFVHQQSKMGQLLDVYKTKHNVSKSHEETLMNPIIITTISALALSILIFLSRRMIRRASRQPILIEQRKIIYRRRP